MDRRTREFDAKLVEQTAQFERERVSLSTNHSRGCTCRSAETFEAAGDPLEASVHLAAAIDSSRSIMGWKRETEGQGRSLPLWLAA